MRFLNSFNICKSCTGILDWFKVLVYLLILKSLFEVNGKSYLWCDLEVFCEQGDDGYLMGQFYFTNEIKVICVHRITE